jgi:hypothetical protein
MPYLTSQENRDRIYYSVGSSPLTQSAPTPVQSVTPAMIQQMIISAFSLSALGLR